MEPVEDPPQPWTVGERALVVLAVLTVIAAAKIAEAFIVPVVVGTLMSYSLDPLERWHIHRLLCALLALVCSFAIFAGSAFLLRADATALVADLPDAARQLR